MNKTFKKIAASIMAISTLAVSMVGMSASAVSFEASHTFTPAVPSSGMYPDHITVYHKKSGADALCNSNHHTSISATSGTTRIECENYAMSAKDIVNTGDIHCNPDVGTPTTNIAVKYKVSAITTFAYDTFTTGGNIVKS